MAAIQDCQRAGGRFALRLAVALGAALVLFGSADAARAQSTQAAPWCANLGGGWGFDCSFHTLAQCLDTARGLGGSCAPNPRAYYRTDRNAKRQQRGDGW